MGILNSRKRIVDIVMTPLGRESLARGGFNVAYASFTDGQAYYDPSSISGSYDTATDRIYLESPASLPQDLLALVTDDSGDLIPATAFGDGDTSSGVTISSDGSLFIISGSQKTAGTDPSGKFSSAVAAVVNMFQNSFEKNMIIGSRDPIDDESSFLINPTETSFQIPADTSEFSTTSINSADSLFFDKRFSNLPQFKFLPPVAESAGAVREIAQFTNIKQYNSYTYSDLKSEVFGTDSNPIKQRTDIEIQQTSLQNDLVLQLYEINTSGITKLDAVDYGNIVDTSDPIRPLKRIVFFGKVYLDDTETATYVNLFTVVID